MSGKVGEKSGNLIMTGEWPPYTYCDCTERFLVIVPVAAGLLSLSTEAHEPVFRHAVGL